MNTQESWGDSGDSDHRWSAERGGKENLGCGRARRKRLERSMAGGTLTQSWPAHHLPDLLPSEWPQDLW